MGRDYAAAKEAEGGKKKVRGFEVGSVNVEGGKAG
jgi:hypothetical protein